MVKDMEAMEATEDIWVKATEAIWVKAMEEVAKDALISKKPHTTVEAAAVAEDMDITPITGLSTPMTRIIIPT